MIRNFNELSNEIKMLDGNINRICVTHDDDEIDLMYQMAKFRLDEIYMYNRTRISELSNTNGFITE